LWHKLQRLGFYSQYVSACWPLVVLRALEWAKNTLWTRLWLCLYRVFLTGVYNLHNRGSLLEHIAAQPITVLQEWPKAQQLFRSTFVQE
jgi:hypothetical protein